MAETRCDLRSYRECACSPGECRVQDLGTFQGAAAARREAPPLTTGELVAGAIAFLAVLALFLYRLAETTGPAIV